MGKLSDAVSGLSSDMRGTNKGALRAAAEELDPGYGEDIGKSLIQGGRNVITGTLGLPGDILKAGRWGLEKIGVPTAQTPLMGSEEVSQELSGLGWQPYQSKTLPGEFTQTAGSIAPFILGGPGSLAAKGIKAITAPLAIEGAGQTARQVYPEAEPAVRMGTALATGLRKPPMKVPTSANYGSTAAALYDRLDRTGTAISPSALGRLRSNVNSAIGKKGYDPDFHTEARDFLRMFDKKIAQAGSVGVGATGSAAPTGLSFSTFKNLRQDAKSLYGTRSKHLAPNVTDALDDFWANLKAGDVLIGGRTAGSAASAGAAKAAADARQAYFMQKKAALLDDIEKSILQKSEQFSVSGMENALRTKMRQLSTKIEGKSKASRLLRGTFTKAERRRIDQMANKPWSLSNLSRYAAKYSPASSIAGVGIGGAGALGTFLTDGDPTPLMIAAGVLGIGGAGRGIGNAMARKQWREFSGRAKGGVQPPRNIPGAFARGAVARQSSLDHAQSVLGSDTFDAIKRDPRTRTLFNKWIEANANGENPEKATSDLANAIADMVKRPDLAQRIIDELGGQ